MTKVIGDPKRSGRAALGLTAMLGLLALAAALVSLGCASKERVAEIQPIGREAPPAQVSPVAPGETVSPEAKTTEAPIASAPAEQPPGKDNGGSPAKQETAPPVATAPSRPEATPPDVKAPKDVTPPKAPAPPAPSEPPRAKKSPEPSPSKPAATPTLDLKSLEKRLRETKAIGIFTKLSLKNQVDDLLDQFRAFHQGKGGTKLAELRQSYDLLMMKVLSLLQDSDAPLARDIVTSRETIWSLLADPAKFATLS
ncbi:MAG TPA: hypothetical protein VGT00_04950 [Methylomirabilota bacterium]|jgi:hypothetical protein|nr:hypothetical protein [Methylomirabilota bacterium]